MKQFFKIITIVSLVLVLVSADSPAMLNSSSDSYDIVKIYEKIELPSGTKCQDDYGSIHEATKLFSPTQIDFGTYEIEVTRLASNFYQICGTSLYVETRYCYEYATYEDAILRINSNGYTKGQLIFLD